jgi:hypothetical protein
VAEGFDFRCVLGAIIAPAMVVAGPPQDCTTPFQAARHLIIASVQGNRKPGARMSHSDKRLIIAEAEHAAEVSDG